MLRRIADVGSLDISAYSVTLVPSTLMNTSQGGQESLPDLPQRKRIKQYQLGERLEVKWTAPANCSRRDWIGLYRHGANKSKLVTRSRSRGRWYGIYPDEWEGDQPLSEGGLSRTTGDKAARKEGTLLYGDSRLFWKPGQYEFRYHHDGKHNVMAVSEPFQIIGQLCNLRSSRCILGN